MPAWITKEKDIYELSDFVENTVVPTMERQNGVASVNTTGAIEKNSRNPVEPGKNRCSE